MEYGHTLKNIKGFRQHLMSFFKFFIKIASHLSIDNICPPNLFECSIIIKMSMIARKVSFKNFWSFGVFFSRCI